MATNTQIAGALLLIVGISYVIVTIYSIYQEIIFQKKNKIPEIQTKVTPPLVPTPPVEVKPNPEPYISTNNRRVLAQIRIIEDLWDQGEWKVALEALEKLVSHIQTQGFIENEIRFRQALEHISFLRNCLTSDQKPTPDDNKQLDEFLKKSL